MRQPRLLIGNEAIFSLRGDAARAAQPALSGAADEVTVAVPGAHGVHRYRALDAAEIERLAAHARAIEFHGWSPHPR